MKKIKFLLDVLILFFNKQTLLLTYPKVGSTFVRLLVFNYINLSNKKEIKMTHMDLNKNMPELGNMNTFNGISLIKTHRLIYFYSGKKITILRNPIDTLCSYYTHMLRNDEFTGSINKFLNSRFGIKLLRKHLNFYSKLKQKTNSNLIILKYTDLTDNPKYVLETVLSEMNILIDYNLLNKTLKEVTRENLIIAEKKQEKSISTFSSNKNYENIKAEISERNYAGISDLDNLFQRLLV